MPIETDDDQDVVNIIMFATFWLSQAMFPIETWNHYKAGTAVIASTTNAAEGWHFGLHQAFFQLWTFVQGIEKDLYMQRSSFLQRIAGAQSSVTYT